MQGIGVLLLIIGILISLSGLGAVIGIPLVIIGVVMLFAPTFSFIAIFAYLISIKLGGNSFNDFAFIFIAISVVGGAFQFYIQNRFLIMTNISDSEVHRDCSYCGEPIKSIAIKCKHCQSQVEPLVKTLKVQTKLIEEDESFSECPICDKVRLKNAYSCDCGFIFIPDR